MFLYRLLDRVFPHSYAAKIFFVAFLGTQLPLIAVMSFVGSNSVRFPFWSFEFAVVVLATLAGTFASLFGIWRLLAPLRQIEADLRSFEGEGALPPNRNASKDDVGRLAESVAAMARSLSARLDVARGEAQVDPLTTVLNRRGFFDMVDIAAPKSAALLYLDLDKFKALNDSRGHLAGDRMLVQTAEAMKRVTRDHDLVARLGGDEFIVVLPNAEPDHAAEVARRIREEVMRAAEAMDASVTASVGVTFRRPQVSWPEAVDRADKAMLEAKASGRNRSKMAS